MIFIHSFIPDIFVAPLYVHHYEVLPTTAIDTVSGFTRRSYRQL